MRHLHTMLLLDHEEERHRPPTSLAATMTTAVDRLDTRATQTLEVGVRGLTPGCEEQNETTFFRPALPFVSPEVHTLYRSSQHMRCAWLFESERSMRSNKVTGYLPRPKMSPRLRLLDEQEASHTIDEHHAWHVERGEATHRGHVPDTRLDISHIWILPALDILEETEFLLHLLPDLHFGHA